MVFFPNRKNYGCIDVSIWPLTAMMNRVAMKDCFYLYVFAYYPAQEFIHPVNDTVQACRFYVHDLFSAEGEKTLGKLSGPAR